MGSSEIGAEEVEDSSGACGSVKAELSTAVGVCGVWDLDEDDEVETVEAGRKEWKEVLGLECSDCTAEEAEEDEVDEWPPPWADAEALPACCCCRLMTAMASLRM